MKTTIDRLIIMLLLILYVPYMVFAETIQLKSGKTLTGSVINKTDEYIKIKTENGTYKVRYSSIVTKDVEKMQRINSDNPTANEIEDKNPEENQISDQDSVVGWTGWYMTSSFYMNQMEKTFTEVEQVSLRALKKLAFAGRKNDRVKIVQIMEELRREMNELFEALESVTPPPEFEKYHAKMIEYQGHSKKIPRTFLLVDRKGYFIARKRALRSLVEALEELRALFVKHNAPSDYIKGLDQSINLYRGAMEIQKVRRPSVNQRR